MAGTGEKIDSLRLSRFETKRLVWALVLSLAAHFLVWGGYELGKKSGLWQRLHWPEKLHLAQKKAPPPVQESEPMMFLDVDPDQVSPDAPKDAKYYSAKNSRAANPDADRDLNKPKLTGKQPDVPKVRDVPRTPVTKPQPAPEPLSPQKEQQQAQPKPSEQPGEMKLAKLDTSPEKKEAPERPRTLKEARAQQQTLRPSMAMQQEGGISRHALVPSFDSKATAFGEYDAQVFDAIQQCWNDELYSQSFAQDRKGRVTLQFRLNYDGSVSDMKVLNNEVGELLSYVCQQAVVVPAPFAKWPSDMRREIGDNYRQITITFIYY